MAGRTGRSGGARAGAGRRPLREKYARPIQAAEKLIAAAQEQAARNLIALANGGLEKHATEHKLAGEILIERAMRDANGDPILGPRGNPLFEKVPLFPDLPADQMVATKTTLYTVLPCRQSNEYLLDRLQGKPAAAVDDEPEDDESDGATVIVLPNNGRDARDTGTARPTD